MRPEIAALITKGERSLRVSRQLCEQGDHDFAVSRAYYAMFYLTEALLLSLGMTFSKHGAIIAAFGQEFVKTGLFSQEHHAALRAAFDQRSVGDYDSLISVTRETAVSLLDSAGRFVEAAKAYLQRHSPGDVDKAPPRP